MDGPYGCGNGFVHPFVGREYIPADQVGPPPQSVGADSPLNEGAVSAVDAATLRTVQEAGPYRRGNDIEVGTVVPDGPLPSVDRQPSSDRTAPPRLPL